MNPVPTSPSSDDYLARRRNAIPRGLAQAHPVFAARARNAELWDSDGRRYIDFGCGIAVTSTGHAHPAITAAVAEQIGLFHHTCFQVVGYESYLRLAERLNALAPCVGPNKTLLFNSGAEAVENAVKVARAATGRSGVISFHRGFHGRTLFALGLTGKIDPYKRGFGPFAAEVFHAPYPATLHGTSTDDALAGVETLLTTAIEPSRVAAILVEPVQGEGGYHPAPAGFLHGLREIADRHGMLLIADEVQSGIARTGRMFAIEHSGVAPDLVTLAKALGGGFPIAALSGRGEVMDAVAPGGLGTTFGGNPVSCAAANAVLDVVEHEGLCARAQALGARMHARLAVLADHHPEIAEVRGLGMMIALEFMHGGKPMTAFTLHVVHAARDAGLLLLTCGQHHNVVRLMPPLTIELSLLDEGLEILAQAIASAADAA